MDFLLSLRENFNVHENEDGSLWLLSERKEFQIRSGTAVAVIKRIDGCCQDAFDLVKSCSMEGIEPVEVLATLNELLQKKILVRNGKRVSLDGFWSEMGRDMVDRDEIALSTTVQVKGIGIPEEDLFHFREKISGANCLESPLENLEVVLVDDLLNPELAKYLESNRDYSKSFLLAKPGGTQATLGPLIGNIEKGFTCYDCLRDRLVRNREEAWGKMEDLNTEIPLRPYYSNTQVREIMVNILLLELGKESSPGFMNAFGRQILRFDAKSLEMSRYEVFQSSFCTYCNDSKETFLTNHHPFQDASKKKEICPDLYRLLPLEETWRKISSLVNPLTGLVKELKPWFPVSEAPVYNYSAGSNNVLNAQFNKRFPWYARSVNGGKGTSGIQAKVSAVSEAIERDSLRYRSGFREVRGCLKEIKGAVHPNDCMLFSEAQFKNRILTNEQALTPFDLVPKPFPEDRSISWIPVDGLVSGEIRYIPTGLCFGNYSKLPLQDRFFYADTNGCAAGNSLEEAILYGFLELVERDAVSIWWYNRLKLPRLELAGVRSRFLKNTISWYGSLGREIEVYSLTNDLGIPVFAAVSFERQDSGSEKILFGFGAHVSAKIALERALTEMNQLLPTLQKRRSWGGKSPMGTWLKNERLEYHPHLNPEANSQKVSFSSFQELCTPGIGSALEYCLNRAGNCGLDVFALNTSQPENVLSVAKVFAPGLRHFWRRTGAGRLFQVPLKMGWRSGPVSEEELNPQSFFL